MTEGHTPQVGDRIGPGRLGHQPALDGMRAVAALEVVGFHAHIPGFAHGGIGVDVFFTLSGFLITSLLLNSIRADGTLDYRTFYARRALRLLPAYLVVVLVAIVADFFVNAGGTLKGAVASFFYVANWAVGALNIGLGSLGHTWSLSIEEQFYLIWPIVLVLLARRATRRFKRAVLTLMMMSYCASLIGVAVGVSAQLIYNATPTRAVQLLAGAFLAAILTPQPVTRLKPWLVDAAGAGSLCLLIVIASLPPLDLAAEILIYWPVVALLTCVIIASTFKRGGILKRLLSFPLLTAVGRTSYGLYLWHFPVFTTIDASLGLRSWQHQVLGLVVTAALVPLSYKYIEKPFLRRKDRMSGAANPGPTTQSALSATGFALAASESLGQGRDALSCSSLELDPNQDGCHGS